MRSLSSVGLGLSVVFGCLLLALVAELYYLLWWKKRIPTKNRDIQDDYSSPAREFLYMLCWKKPTSLTSTETLVHEPQPQLQPHSSNDLWCKRYAEEDASAEAELLRLQNLAAQPRFLFTIKEETKEDLDSEDKSRKGSSSRGRSMSDLVFNVETPFLTPLASPPYFTPPLTPTKKGGLFNPLFQSSSDEEFNRIRLSPPPRFKFLRDAEEKLFRRKLMEDIELGGSVFRDDEENDDGVTFATTTKYVKDEDYGSFSIFTLGNSKDPQLDEQQHNLPHHPSSSSQILPLAASPPTFRSKYKKDSISR